MDNKDWTFKEEQRDAVCKGEMCPRCLGKEIESRGAAPDGINLNMSWHCRTCKETWEGY